MAEKQILTDLAEAINSQARSAVFACGGSVPFAKEASNAIKKEDSTSSDSGDDEMHHIAPVQIRFGDSGKGYTVVLPCAHSPTTEFNELLAACKPASFGRGGEEVLDEEYRKAGKLDIESFTTNFCPYEAGIIDVVAQLLLPQMSHGKHERSLRVSSLLSLS